MSENEFYIFPTMYVYCIYPAISKSLKTTAKLSKRAVTSVILIVFVPCEACAYTVTLSYQHDSDTRKTISWSKTVYDNNLSSQCNLTAQIELLHDKYIYFHSIFINEFLGYEISNNLIPLNYLNINIYYLY